MEIFRNENCTLLYEEDNKLLIQKWEGFAVFDDFKAAIDKTVDFSSEKKVKFILSDTREQKIVGKDNSEYAKSVMPQLVRNGLTKMAFVFPTDIFNKIAVKKFTNETNTLDIQYFDDDGEARAWLLEK